jgi:bloom syndrome protein
MMYLGKPLALTQIQEVFAKLEGRIIELWENEVMLGLGLHIEYEDLADNLVTSEAGYSFVSDPNNPFHRFHGALVEAICDDPKLFERFTIAVPGVQDRQLNVMECRKWLNSLAELEGLVILYTDMTGGAPPRGTELVSMLFCNTRYRKHNLFAMGKFITVVRQYDKTSNITQTDRLIPHAVGSVAGDILVHIHAIARPFARVSFV